MAHNRSAAAPHRKKRLPVWQKAVMLALAITTAIMLLFDTALYRGIFVTPNTITSRFIQLESDQIPAAMDQVSIVFISDLEYSSDFKTSTGDDLFRQIASLDPDILLIGGDFFSAEEAPTQSSRDLLTSWLSSIKAPLGKFAVYGEQDLCDTEHEVAVNDVCSRAQIELLSNSSVMLSNHSAQGVRLAGLQPQADLSALAGTLSDEQYTLLLSHYPDNLIGVQDAGLPVDYALAGNSHGSQIKWPLFGNYRLFEGSTTINRSKMRKLAFPYLITSGIGCIELPLRLNSPVEFVHITLLSGAAPAASKESSLASSPSSASDAPSTPGEETESSAEMQADPGENTDGLTPEDPAAESTPESAPEESE